jgi:hypothetical protein
MVDSADPGFYGAAWRFTDFCQHLFAGSVYLQLVLKSCGLPGLFRSFPRSALAHNSCSRGALAADYIAEWDERHRR